jgi:RNA recognition motif-containing protein
MKKPIVSSEKSQFMVNNKMSALTQIAYVQFNEQEHAAAAINSLNGKNFDMNKLRVSYYGDKGTTAFTPARGYPTQAPMMANTANS